MARHAGRHAEPSIPSSSPSDGVTRIDWNISHDEQTIAWTETSGDPSALTTTTWIAGIDGADSAQVFSDGPRNGIRAYPVAFSEDKSILYMDYQPNTIGDLTPFPPVRRAVRARPDQRRDQFAAGRTGLLLRRGHRRRIPSCA